MACLFKTRWREERKEGRIEEGRAGCFGWLFIAIHSWPGHAGVCGLHDSRAAGKVKVSNCLCCAVVGESCFTPVWEKYFVAPSHGKKVHFNSDCCTKEKVQETEDNTAHIYIVSVRHRDSQGFAEILTLRECQVLCGSPNLPWERLWQDWIQDL